MKKLLSSCDADVARKGKIVKIKEVKICIFWETL